MLSGELIHDGKGTDLYNRIVGELPDMRRDTVALIQQSDKPKSGVLGRSSGGGIYSMDRHLSRGREEVNTLLKQYTL